MGIAKNIVDRREALDLTQEELAAKVGVGQSFLSQIERGFKIPSVEVTKRLADALEVTVDELIS